MLRTSVASPTMQLTLLTKGTKTQWRLFQKNKKNNLQRYHSASNATVETHRALSNLIFFYCNNSSCERGVVLFHYEVMPLLLLLLLFKGEGFLATLLVMLLCSNKQKIK